MIGFFKHLFIVNRLGLLSIFLLLINSSSISQCIIGATVGGFNASTLLDDTPVIINDSVEAGEYVPITNLVINKTYVLSTCGDAEDTYLTLFNSANTAIAFSDDDCGDDGEITFVAPYSGTYKIQVNIAACGTNANDHEVTATRLSCSYPSNPNITLTQDVSCFGDSAIFTFGGSLNDALYWKIYKDSCGGEVLDSTTTNTYKFAALANTRKYFVRGEGNCTSQFGSCDSVTLTTVLNNANFLYSSINYCVSDADDTPVVSGVPGGSFSPSSGGLAINTSTGTIDMSASTAAQYFVRYTTPGTCPNTDSVEVVIKDLDDASFSFSSSSFCKNELNPPPSVTGISGGLFSFSPAGLVIDASTGIINLTTSSSGTYSVTYTTAGDCPNSSSQSITINSVDNASFSYSSTSFCSDNTDPLPTIVGVSGGAFSSTSGIILNNTSGLIDLSASTAGYYNLNYTTSGTCPITASTSVTINALDDANFDYGKTTFCLSESDPFPLVNNTGTFTFSPSGLMINSSTGQIDINNSTANTYAVTYTTNVTCPNSLVKNITISPLDNANYAYGSSNYCQLDTDPTPVLTGLSGGSYTYSPFGLSINSSTGEIDLDNSIPKAYSITYTTSGNCPNSLNVPVTINISDDPSFNYSNTNYCISSSDPSATISGLPGGVFSSSPIGLSINSASGLVDISNSSIGNYNVVYTTTGTCPNSLSRAFSISNSDDASFNYSSSTFCAFDINSNPTITGSLGGIFSSTSGLTIASSTGFINTGASNEGTYTVTYTTSGDCINSSTQEVTIVSADDASFNYDAVQYCDSELDPTPAIVGEPGGMFSAVPVGLIINSASGEVDLSLSTANLYTITYTTSGSCPDSSTQSFIVNASSDPGFGYTASNYCTTESDPSPIITGASGGVFSSMPTGVVMDNYTGVIELTNSDNGAYNITYSVSGQCPSSETVSIVINDPDDASFNFGSSNYCTSGIDPTPSITGAAGGAFSSTPSGLSINSSSGLIDVSTSNVAIYTISYLTNGSCPAQSLQNISISNFDDASFSYSATTFCQTSLDPTPTITGLLGGVFSASPGGLAINATTGELDASASIPAAYTITYATSGDCPNTSNQTITIANLDDANFNFSSSVFCVNETNPTPSITGLIGGIFNSSSSGLVIDLNTGTVDISLSTPDIYLVNYTTNGNCPNTSSQSLEIKDLDDANFSYGSSSFCSSDADPLAILSGMSSGVFSASPTGLIFDSNTGEIDISSSNFNTYTVSFTTTGPCPNTSSQTVQIVPFDDASFTYSANTYCLTNTNPLPTITGVLGGTFSNAPSGLSIDPSTGEIDPSNSLLGTYSVTYTTIGNCQNSSVFSVNITDVDDATFSYGTPNFCVENIDPTPLITGVTGGVFNSQPVGLSINSSSGLIDISSSSFNSYSIEYTTPGSCPTTSLQPFNLIEVPVTNQTINACDSSNLFGNVYYSSQIVLDTLSGVLCDSIINTNLVMSYSSAGTDIQSTWCNFVWIDGLTYTESNNTATHIVTNSVGCDSLVQLDLTISGVDITVNDLGTIFTANAVNVDYQWLDCNLDYWSLIDETNQTFYPTLNGSYAVMITDNSCTDTSDCFDLFDLSINNNREALAFEIYPNPFSEIITLNNDLSTNFTVVVSDLGGRIVHHQMFRNQTTTDISLAHLEDGVYLIRILSEGKEQVHKVFKN